MRKLFARCVSVTVVLGGLVACGHMHVPSFSNPLNMTSAPANGAQPGTADAQPARPSPIPASSPDVVITQLTATPDADESSPALSPDGSIVLFSTLDGANRKDKTKATLAAVDVHHASAPSQYSGDGVRALDPTFAPDGRSYFFISDAMGKWAVVHSGSASPAAALTLVSSANVTEPRHPSVSPDGARVAFSMKKAGAPVIATSQVDGSRLSVLGPGTSPTYSPDGARLVFVRAAGARTQIFTMDAATGRGVTQITTGDFDAMSPAYSPDGAFVAFVSNRGAQSKARNVYVVRTDGTQLRQLTNGSHEVRDLSWGRDGAIYFAADPDGSGQLDVFRLVSKDFVAAPQAAPVQPQPQPAPLPVPQPVWTPQPAPQPSPQPQPIAQPQPQPQPAPVASGPTCNTWDDCANLPCVCNDGRVVNTRECNNHVCAPAQSACENSCRRHSGFAGRLAGGAPVAQPQPQQPQTPAPAPAPKLGVGKTCSQDNECESNVCVFRGNASRGYCSKECQSWSECPSFWECQHVRNGSAQYCVQK